MLNSVQNNSISHFSEKIQELMLPLYFLNTWEIFKCNKNEIKLDRKKAIFFIYSKILVIGN